MKKGLLILVVALAVGLLAYWVTRHQQQAERKEVLLDSIPELAWLRVELNLSDEQFAKASALHVAYRPTCMEMCRSIAAAHAKLETLTQGNRAISPELEEAIRDHARVHAECQVKMLEHLYQTAKLLDAKQSARYLETVLPHALDSPGGRSGGSHHE